MLTTNWATATINDGPNARPMGIYVEGQPVTGAEVYVLIPIQPIWRLIHGLTQVCKLPVVKYISLVKYVCCYLGYDLEYYSTGRSYQYQFV